MIRFSKFIWIYVVLSSMVLLPGIYSLIRWGLLPSIDFTGGTVLEVQLEKNLPLSEVDTIVKKHALELVEMGQGDKNVYTFRLKATTDEKLSAFQKDLQQSSGEKLIILKKDTVGPLIGKELLSKAVVASLFVLAAILSYVAYAFKSVKFGVAAVFALFHDTLVLFGIFSILGHVWKVEVDTLFVTAFLTTMSFSVHDTIVIFDRIREYRKKDSRTKLSTISDIALTETMVRSLVNSFTIMFMLLSLVLMGGDSVRWFAAALLIGTITGTYSSPFVATPIVLLLDAWEQKRRA